MKRENYFLKNGYIANTEIQPVEDFWDEERIRASRYYQFHVYKFAASVMRQKNLKSVIDVGCGTGSKLRLFKGFEVYGIDSPAAIELARSLNPTATFWAANLETETPNPGRKFDLVLCADVLEHLQNPDTVMKFLLELAGNNSYLIISTPDRDSLRGKDCTSVQGAHVREWNVAELAMYVKSFGLSIEETRKMLPVKIAFNRLFYRDVIKRSFNNKPIRTNQLLLCKVIKPPADHS
jgi:2-polyprenyl-3-methyl-5-hydroxy-6-metoxy-1,4-benzoquinol methylase